MMISICFWIGFQLALTAPLTTVLHSCAKKVWNAPFPYWRLCLKPSYSPGRPFLSDIPEQTWPDPIKPGSHAHTNDPMLSLQVAFAWQLCPPVAHSLTFLHVCPLPSYPGKHLQVYEPSLSVHWALLSQRWLPIVHSSMLEQLTPVPVNPIWHIQLNVPEWSVQVAFPWQSWLPSWHSLMLPHVMPVPLKPLIQTQLYDPIWFMQVALLWHVCVSRIHSSTSMQVMPSPSKPSKHVHVNPGRPLLQVALTWHGLPSAHSLISEGGKQNIYTKKKFSYPTTPHDTGIRRSVVLYCRNAKTPMIGRKLIKDRHGW